MVSEVVEATAAVVELATAVVKEATLRGTVNKSFKFNQRQLLLVLLSKP